MTERNLMAGTIALYTCMHVGIFLAPQSVFWDDWILYQTAPETIMTIFREAGSVFNHSAYLNIFLMALGPWIYKVLTFAFFLGSGLSLATVLKRIPGLSPSLRFIILNLFLLLPFNMARIAAIDLTYSLNVFLFFSAWSLMDRKPRTAMALFFLSFNINSLLMFFTLPVLEQAYRDSAFGSKDQMRRFLRKNFLLLAMPFIYFAIKIRFFKPVGQYAGYNENFRASNIWETIEVQINDFANLEPNWRLILFIFPIVLALVFWLLRGFKEENQTSKPVVLFLGGAFALILGLFPYWILGLPPTFFEWTSRHQLLMPFGSSFIIASILIVVPWTFRVATAAFLLSASVAFGIENYLGFYKDWEKQKVLLNLIEKDQSIKSASLIVFDDQTKGLNAIQRTYRFYEWNGLMALALGDETRFGIAPHQIDDYREGQLDRFLNAEHKAGAHHRDTNERAILVTIRFANSPPDGTAWNKRPNLILDSRPL